MILARTFEKFTIPNGKAGQLHGRSSLARLGLSVYCTGGFINPGYRGRMPLQLMNHGVVPIVLTPYITICQLVVTNTTSVSDMPYGAPDAGHVYMNDDGGPSKFWLDRALKELSETFRQGKVAADVQRTFRDVLGSGDAETMDRFSRYFSSLRSGEITSPREVLGTIRQSRHAAAGR